MTTSTRSTLPDADDATMVKVLSPSFGRRNVALTKQAGEGESGSTTDSPSHAEAAQLGDTDQSDDRNEIGNPV
jgi:hypothetical protein